MSTALIFALTLVCLGAMASVSRDQRKVPKDDIIRVERSDDISYAELQSLIQQQSAVIQQQAEALQQQSAAIQALQADVASLENRARKQVAFSVSFTQDTIALNIGDKAPIKFDHVVTNTGSAYNQHTGIFTAPTSGLYLFFLAVREHPSSQLYTGVGVLKSATQLCHTNVEGTANSQWDKGSCMATVHLYHGEQVHAQWTGGQVNIDRGWLTAFNGMLIAADL